MSENSEFKATPAEKRHVSTPNPALEGEGAGQYVEGDNGDTGTVDPSGLTGGLAQEAEGADTVPGRDDDDTEGRVRRD